MFEKRTYVLQDDGVKVTIRTLLSREEFRVPYHSLEDESFITTSYSSQWLRVAIIFGALYVVIGLDDPLSAFSLGFAAFVALFGVLFLASWHRYVGYHAGGGPLYFFAATPSEEELSAFLGKMQDRRREHFTERYSEQGDGGSPIDEIERLHWLRKEGALTDADFEKLKESVISDLDTTQVRAGFRARRGDDASS